MSKLIELVTAGGMSCLKELPGQERTEPKDKYFDEFNTYAPGTWRGSRRLKATELEEYLAKAGLPSGLLNK